MTEQAVAERALDAALKAQADISTHEQVCAERYSRIDDGLTTVKGDVKDLTNRVNLLLIGVGGAMFTVIMALVFK